MKLNLKQAKLVELTMKLDLKAIEYKTLCEKLEEVKRDNKETNEASLIKLLKKFEKNNKEITEINEQLKALKNDITN